jgi:hypothetical protein
VLLLAHAPWYEFWRHGLWQYAEWTHVHASWWVWLIRAEFLIGGACAVLLLVVMAGGGDTYGEFSFYVGFSALVVFGLAVVPVAVVQFGVGLWALLAQFVFLFALVSGAVERLTREGQGRIRLRGELERIGVEASVDATSAGVRIRLWKPFQLGSCKEIIVWEGTLAQALGTLATLPSECGRSPFFAAFQIAPESGGLATLANELDRLGVSQARTRGRSSWVEATYDPYKVKYTSSVRFESEGLMLDDVPIVGEGQPMTLRFFESLGDALAALGALPDGVGPRGFWLAVGERDH